MQRKKTMNSQSSPIQSFQMDSRSPSHRESLDNISNQSHFTFAIEPNRKSKQVNRLVSPIKTINTYKSAEKKLFINKSTRDNSNEEDLQSCEDSLLSFKYFKAVKGIKPSCENDYTEKRNRKDKGNFDKSKKQLSIDCIGTLLLTKRSSIKESKSAPVSPKRILKRILVKESSQGDK